VAISSITKQKPVLVEKHQLKAKRSLLDDRSSLPSGIGMITPFNQILVTNGQR
jgi:hypothetical protein